MDHDPVLDAVGPRLRSIRQRRGATLAELSEATGISVSTLSRLESGGRRPTLELLLALADQAEARKADVVYGAWEPIIDSFFKECASIAYVAAPE